jgi:putative ABC transport system permease protein
VLPLDPGWRMPFLVKGRPAPPRGEEPRAQYHSASDGYFEALGARLRAGRTFDAHDTATSEPVVVINETLARQQFAGQDPVGQTITSSSTAIGPLGRTLMPGADHRIIGVVADVKNHTLQAAAEPAIYNSVRQYPFRTMFLTVRGAGDPAALTAGVREALRGVDPALPLSNVRPLTALVAGSVQQSRLLTYLMSGFAVLALALAALGIYGMLAYAVGQRRQEISIRLALGATPAAVLWLVLRQGLTLTVIGILVGAASGLAISRILASVVANLLFGIGAADAATLAAVIVMVLGVAVAACLVPARRAAALDPLAGLRTE